MSLSCTQNQSTKTRSDPIVLIYNRKAKNAYLGNTAT